MTVQQTVAGAVLSDSVPAPGTLPRVSPRAGDDVPDDVRDVLLAAQRELADAERSFRAEVRAALEHASIRRVAAVLGLSPTTVQKWSKVSE